MKRSFTLSRKVTLAGTGLLLLGPVPVLAETFTVTNTDDSGWGSLRYALTQANDSPFDDRIEFNIPGRGVHTIAVLSELPASSGTVAIDGTTQPGYDGRPLVRLDGAGVDSEDDVTGLRLGYYGSSVRGLNVTGFDVGLSLEGWGGHSVTRCFIGTDPTGRLARGNGTGISVVSSNNTIGGRESGARNLISGNDSNGITVEGFVLFNTIRGNWIGTDVEVTDPIGNGASGIDVAEALETNILENVIVGSGGHGVFIWKGALGTSLFANDIGTDFTGDIPLGNGGSGVFIQDASSNRVGDVAEGKGNRIAYNSGSGVTIVGNTSRRNTVRGNWSGSNRGPGRGVDLGGDGATLNDLHDTDLGPNTLQNTPGVVLAGNADGKTTVVVRMSGTPGRTFTVDLYVSPWCGSWFGDEPEKAWLTAKTVETDGRSGLGTLLLTTHEALPLGAGVIAVATDAAGNTSEYSLCKTVL